MQGYDFGKVGGKDGHAGVIHKPSRFAGAYLSQHVVKRGDPSDSSCAAIPLASTTCSKRKKKKVR